MSYVICAYPAVTSHQELGHLSDRVWLASDAARVSRCYCCEAAGRAVATVASPSFDHWFIAAAPHHACQGAGSVQIRGWGWGLVVACADPLHVIQYPPCPRNLQDQTAECVVPALMKQLPISLQVGGEGCSVFSVQGSVLLIARCSL